MIRKVAGWLAVLPILSIISCQPIPPPATGIEGWSSEPTFFKTLQTQELGSNGIEVGEPQIYDDSSLRLMLHSAEQRLAAINGLNESALTSRLGAVTGSRIDQTQVGLQITGAPLPQVVTTAPGATTQTSTDADGNVSTITNAPRQDVQTTAAAMAPPAPPTIPAGLGFTAPAGMSVSALDALNEELQLTYQITGLRLYLEGALSDRFARNQRIIKPRATIGFPISIKPQERYKNAVAVVEVEVSTAENKLTDEPPTITALFPQEETHNVAGLTDRTTSIGAGAIIGTVGISGNFLRARRTFYLVQDQDTVAIQRPANPDSENKESTTSFAWEFRPVLGREFVRGGLKRTFVQLAFPVLDQDCIGTIRVRTYWRHFDQKTGIAKEVIEGSLLKREELFAVPKYDLAPFVEDVVYQDLGDGTVFVNVQGAGSFLAGTYVQLGPTRYDASNGLRIEESGITFIAPSAALARWTGQVVSRDGERADLLKTSVQKKLSKLDQLACIGKPVEQEKEEEEDGDDCSSGSVAIKEDEGGKDGKKGITLRPLNENETEVHVELASTLINERDFSEILLEVGNKVFGLTDTLVSRKFAEGKDGIGTGSITAVVPTSLLVKDQRVRVFRPFWTAPDGEQARDPRNDCFTTFRKLPDFDLDSAVERLVLVSADKKMTTYLLYGNSLGDVAVIPEDEKPQKKSTEDKDEHIELRTVGELPGDRVRLLIIPSDKLPTMKKIVLQKKKDGRPLVLDLPKPEAKPVEPPKVTLDSPIVQNTDELDVSVERSGDLKSVKIGGRALQFTPGKDSVRLKNLRNDGVTTEQKIQEITFEFNDETKVKVKLGVVAARVGVTGAPN